jgi:hypothetical protein
MVPEGAGAIDAATLAEADSLAAGLDPVEDPVLAGEACPLPPATLCAELAD